MARRASGVNKSKAIRDYKEKNAGAGPKAVVEGLAAEGIKVTPQFVSTVLSNAKRKSGKRRGRPPGRRAATVANGSLKQLLQAKRLAEQMGGVSAARQALDVLARLGLG